MKKSICSVILLLSTYCYGQTDTIRSLKHNLKIKNLVESKSQFAVWSKNELSGKLSNIILWERNVAFAKKDGRKIITVTQKRFFEDSTKNTLVFTVSNREDFRTIYDYRKDKKGVQAYDYHEGQITGSDTVINNVKAGFNLLLPVLTFCFELDVETLSMLPIQHVGQIFFINFYHPGGNIPPRFYPVSVIGEDTLGYEGAKLKCWILRLDYDDGKNYDLSWISKKHHAYIKLESHSPGVVFNKVRLFTDVKTL